MSIRRIIIVILAVGTLTLFGMGMAHAFATQNGPTTNDDKAFNSIVHVCIPDTSEHFGYWEEHTSPMTIGNCASGQTQAEINEPYIAPTFTVNDFPAATSASPSPSPTSVQTCTVVMSNGQNGTDPNQIVAFNCHP